MKKNYLFLAAAATMFTACVQNDVVNEMAQESAPQAIGFETFSNKATRAENSTQTETLGLDKHHGDFRVWAYKNTMNPAYVFEDVTVSYNSVNKKWEYTPLKYWDKSANKYEFYAASPASAGWSLNRKSSEQNDDYFTLVNFTLDDVTIKDTEYQESFKGTTTQDLMVASPETIGEEDILNPTSVQLDFNHILSRLNVTVKKPEALTATVVLTSISVNNLPNTGSFDESKAISVASSTERWTIFDYKGKITGNTLAEVTKDASHVIQSLVMPQTVVYESIDRDGTNNAGANAPYLYIEYTIGGEPFNASYNLANAFGKTEVGEVVSFFEGWQNTLNITLNASSIVFEAVTYKWADDAVKNPTID